MYSTCIFCNSSLSANEVIAHFPIGRRLAFDPDKGRLWVVCGKCERWNLSPLDERWEAIEECERAFRDTKTRASTANVGFARVTEGLELVRIGSPQRPEMAAWRYGDQLGRRRRRYYTNAGLGIATAGGIYVIFEAQRRAFGRVKLAMPWMDQPYVLEANQVSKATLVLDDTALGWALRVPVSRKKFVLPDQPQRIGDPPVPRLEYTGKMTHAVFAGEEAIRLAGKLLSKINGDGAGKDDVQRAVQLIQEDADPARFFAAHTKLVAEQGQILKMLPKPVRLALEMSVHEDAERRALEGELALLEAAWKEADEIAGISDNLLLPDDVETWFAKLRHKR